MAEAELTELDRLKKMRAKEIFRLKLYQSASIPKQRERGGREGE